MNETGNYAEFKLSDKSEDLVISSLYDENKVEIDGKEYVISDTYLECSKNDESKKIKSGMSGEFYFTFDNRIAGCKLSDENRYAYLEKAYKEDETDDVILNLFTEDNKWETLKLNEKVSLDGVSKSAEEVYNYINRENLKETLVTYRTNSNGVKTLNTTKGKIKLDYTHTVKLDWTLGVSIPGADDAAYFINYSIRDNTIVFKIPRDKSKKKDYMAFYGNTNLYSGEKFTFNFYDSDDFYVARATVAQTYDSAGVSTIEGIHYPVYITSIQQSVNADDEQEYIVNGHFGKNMGGGKAVFQMNEKYKVKEEVFEDLDLEKGKFYNMVVEDGYVSNAEMWFDPKSTKDE